MYRASETAKQADMWKDPCLGMGERTRKLFEDSEGWHHRFRREVTNRIDEDVFKPLFSAGKGAPNAPIRILVAMMALKEGLGISDEQLYEQCRFNALTRSALGLCDSDDEVPVESTYYLFRQKIADYMDRDKGDLLAAAFEGITKGQCREYAVSGKRVRMDSALLGSNIAWYSRYGLVHETIRKYCAANGITGLAGKAGDILAAVLGERAEAVTYRSPKDEVARLFEGLGSLMLRLLETPGAEGNKEYGLLRRVFDEQYETAGGVGGGKGLRVLSRPKAEIRAKSVQNPHDADSEYRAKGGGKVKGYSVNVTETCVDGQLNLVVGVLVSGAGTSDVAHFQAGIGQAQGVVADAIAEAYTDGAYHSPENQEYCKEETIDWTLRGISGKPSRYGLSFDAEGKLVAVNTESGERLEAKEVKRRDPEAPQRWSARDGGKTVYFDRKAVEASELRKRLEGLPKEQLGIRNNVEATIFQLGYHCDGGKSRYRGLAKHRMWSISRCLWVNFRRIQLWVARKAGGEGAGTPGCGLAACFLRKFFRVCRFVVCPPAFAAG